MHLRLRTVRAKLTTLVALSIVVTLAALPLLSWALRQQMLDEVKERTIEAKKSFRAELEDDVADVRIAARVLAASPDTRRALETHDVAAAQALARLFLGVYPDIDLLLVDGTGAVVAELGCNAPPRALSEAPALAALVKPGEESRGVVTAGCEKDADGHASAGVAVAVPVHGDGGATAASGTVVAVLPLDRDYLANSAAKLGLELSLVRRDGPGGTNVLVARTDAFPAAAIPPATHKPQRFDEGERAWAVSLFVPIVMEGTQPPMAVVAALDVTDVRDILRRHFFVALAILLAAGGLSVALGARLASVLSNALERVTFALRRLDEQEYVHVDPVRTGDELEDLATAFNAMVDGLKERDKLKTTMGKYMTASVMEHLMEGRLALGGETIPVTILFTDIRSFTSISERMGAQELVGLLNEYFTEMVGIVMNEEGVVDKYIGDAIMAVFGAPVPRPDDAVHAVRAAVRMRQALRHLNDRLEARGIAKLRTGIGIHTGEVVAGNIGSDRRMEYTVIGDAVNLASRLEGSTKDLGVNVLISEDTYRLVEAHVIARPVREITVKGRAQPVMTYEVLGLRGEALLESARASRSSLPPSAPHG